jgi:hypothetical protein
MQAPAARSTLPTRRLAGRCLAPLRAARAAVLPPRHLQLCPPLVLATPQAFYQELTRMANYHSHAHSQPLGQHHLSAHGHPLLKRASSAGASQPRPRSEHHQSPQYHALVVSVADAVDSEDPAQLQLAAELIAKNSMQVGRAAGGSCAGVRRPCQVPGASRLQPAHVLPGAAAAAAAAAAWAGMGRRACLRSAHSSSSPGAEAVACSRCRPPLLRPPSRRRTLTFTRT